MDRNEPVGMRRGGGMLTGREGAPRGLDTYVPLNVLTTRWVQASLHLFTILRPAFWAALFIGSSDALSPDHPERQRTMGICLTLSRAAPNFSTSPDWS